MGPPRPFFLWVALAAAAHAGAQDLGAVPGEGATYHRVSLGWFDPLDSERRFDSYTLGYRYVGYVRDGFALELGLDLHAFDGESDDAGVEREVETEGAGASLGLRWDFAGGRLWRAFVGGRQGFLWTEDHFPPGGSPWNGLRELGFGVAARLGERHELLLELAQRHVSNGRGLTAENPSYDGLGAYVSFARAHRPGPGSFPDRSPAVELDRRADLRVEGAIGEADDESLAAVALLAELPLDLRWRVQAEAALGQLGDEPLEELGLHLVARGTGGVVAAGAQYRRFADELESVQVALQAEHYANDILSFVGALGLDDQLDFGDDRLFASLGFRIYPLPDVAIQPRAHFLLPEDELDEESLDLGIDLEWSPPWLDRVALFYEERPGDLHSIGMRFYGGPPKPLVDRHREDGLHRLRF